MASVSSAQENKTMAAFAMKAGMATTGGPDGSVNGVLGSGNVMNYLQNRGDLEQALLKKKGMKKSEAAKLAQAQGYMNN